MSSTNFVRSLVASTFLASTTLLGSSAAFAYDPAHHSADSSDLDPVHHQPVVVAPDSPPAGYDSDPAHHSTNLNDSDPAHHQPYWAKGPDGIYRLTPIPSFDLFGNRIRAGIFD